MRAKGINYDTGFLSAGTSTHEPFDPDVVRREMRIIRDDLHCTAVRITGGDPDRLEIAATHAADAGSRGLVLPVHQRSDAGSPTRAPHRLRRSRRAGASARRRGRVPHGLGAEPVHDRIPPGRDASRAAGARDRSAAHPARDRRAPRAHQRLPPPDRRRVSRAVRRTRELCVAEFGCAPHRGAGDVANMVDSIIEWGDDGRAARLKGEYVRDEDEQATYVRELLEVFEAEGVDAAFVYTFARYDLPHRDDPLLDLDQSERGRGQGARRPEPRPRSARPALSRYDMGAESRVRRGGGLETMRRPLHLNVSSCPTPMR
jgi:hypothetical protein